MQKVTEFFNYIYERQLLADRKAQGLLPWSEDPVLTRFKFCSVRRLHDASTRHLMHHIIHTDLPTDLKLLNIILFRRFNVRDFFTNVLQGHWVPARTNLEQALDSAKQRGVRLFSDAYTLNQLPFNRARRPHEKHAQIAMAMKDLAANLRAESLPSKAHEAHRWLQQWRGIGPFLAYQILIDISYAFDISGLDGFVHVGPGALGGLVYLYGTSHLAEERAWDLYRFQSASWRNLELELGKKWLGGALALSDIQHNLCEFRKYKNLQQGKGRRRYYKGEIVKCNT